MTRPVSLALGPALHHAVRGSALGLAPRPLAPRPPLARSVPAGGERGQRSACLGPGGSILGSPASSWERPSCPPRPCAQATLRAPAVSPSMALTKALSHLTLAYRLAVTPSGVWLRATPSPQQDSWQTSGAR